MKFKLNDTAILDGKRVVITEIISEEDDEYESLYQVWHPYTNKYSKADDSDLQVDL